MVGLASVLLFGAGLTLAGVIFTFVGLRGRRVGDHPFCRGCGFDLVGRAADSQRCSECGADLTRPRAMVVRVRQPRRRVGWIGALLLLPGVLLMTLIGWATVRGIDWQSQKPVWWLAREAEGSDVATRDAALKELLARLSVTALSAGQVEGLVARGIVAQGKVNQPWAAGWGDLIEAARGRGQVADAAWQTYARQAAQQWLALRVRERVRRGDPLPYELTLVGARAGRMGRALFVNVSTPELVVDGTTLREMSDGWGINLMPRSGGGRRDSFAGDVLAGLAEERHRGHLCVRVEVMDKPWSVDPRGERNIPGGSVVARVERTFPIEFELLPEDQPSAKAVVDDDLRPRVEKALKVSFVPGGRWVHLPVSCDVPLPVDLHFDVILRQGEREWPVQTITIKPGRGRQLSVDRILRDDEPVPAAAPVDVIFRPSAAEAAKSVELTPYWGEEVVKKDVKPSRGW